MNEDSSNEGKNTDAGKETLKEVNHIEEGNCLIEKAQLAKEGDKKTDAFILYKQGIQLLLKGLKVSKNLTDEARDKLKQKCSEYLSEAEKLKDEINKDKGQSESKTLSPDDDHIVRYVESIIRTEQHQLSLDDVCGCEQAKQKLKECVILPLKFPQLFSGTRKPWKGILLYGAPGTGKTMLVRALSKEVPIVRVPCCELVSKYYGEPERIIKSLFSKVWSIKPCYLCIEDVSYFLSNDETDNRRARTELLVQIQGIEINTHSSEMDTILTSNEPWKIERSILRRLSKRIHIPMPDMEAREEIFKKYLESEDCKIEMDNEEFQIFAEKSNGFTGSDIVCVVKDALMEPIREIQKSTHFRKITNLPADAIKTSTNSAKNSVSKAKPSTDIEEPSTDAAKSSSDMASPTTNALQPSGDISDPLSNTAKASTDIANSSTNTIQPSTDIVEHSTDTMLLSTDNTEHSNDTTKPYTTGIVEQSSNTTKPSTTDIAEPSSNTTKASMETPEGTDYYQYAPCSSDHPDAIAMTFEDLLSEPVDRLFCRPLTKDDVLKCLNKSKPTVDEEYLKKLQEFTDQFT